MKVTFNKELVPSYELTEAETQELEETGYCYDDDQEIGNISEEKCKLFYKLLWLKRILLM